MQLTEDKVKRIYSDYKRRATHASKRGNDSMCLKYLKAAALTAYFFYLDYKDDDLEDLLHHTAKHLKRNNEQTDRRNDECVFYDALSADNQGLVQQYLNAIMHRGMKIRYITERNGFRASESKIKQMLNQYGKAEIIEIPSNLSYIEKAQYVYDRIAETRASRLFIHSHPSSSYACTAFYALPESIKKYKINLTDHTFWIGTRFIDYSFEFRAFGCVLSANDRGIDRKKLLMLPFYPVMTETPFLGFPKEAEGKVVIFSGANNYKIYGKDDIFFKMTKAILDACPEAIFLYAGTGDANELQAKLEQYELVGRFIPIGYRTDITQVFRHCDIFLNTYPIGGALMLQYAAQLSKPILCYGSETTAGAEDIVCQLKQMSISDRDIPSLVKRAKHLVESPENRRAYGEELRNCVVTPERFNQMFATYLENGVNQLEYSDEVSYKEHTKDIQDKLTYENTTKEFQCRLVKIVGVSSLWQCSSILLTSIIAVVKGNRVMKAFKNRKK